MTNAKLATIAQDVVNLWIEDRKEEVGAMIVAEGNTPAQAALLTIELVAAFWDMAHGMDDFDAGARELEELLRVITEAAK